MLDFNKFQEDTDKWISLHKIGYFPAYGVLTRLGEEYGEVAREVMHESGLKPKKDTEKPKEIGQELADIMFTLMCLANPKELKLQEEYKKLNESSMENKYQELISDDSMPSDFSLYWNLEKKIHKLNKEGFKKNPDKTILGEAVIAVAVATNHIAKYHSLDLMTEWDKMMEKKLYGRDKNRYELKGTNS